MYNTLHLEPNINLHPGIEGLQGLHATCFQDSVIHLWYLFYHSQGFKTHIISTSNVNCEQSLTHEYVSYDSKM